MADLEILKGGFSHGRAKRTKNFWVAGASHPQVLMCKVFSMVVGYRAKCGVYPGFQMISSSESQNLLARLSNLKSVSSS